MLAILACSIFALMAIILKFMTLTQGRIVPAKLASEIQGVSEKTDVVTMSRLETECEKGETALARLGAVALKKGMDINETKEAVQTAARAEVVRMTAGLAVLDVVVTIAPLLGLLGTASGLVIVFQDLGAADNNVAIAKGIAVALNTTIAGVAVAVPSVIAHSFFSRKIETMSTNLEILLGHLVAMVKQEGKA